jgi:hypothetical protein
MASDWWTEEGHGVFLNRWAFHASATRPELKRLFHVPNGGWRSPAVAGKLKAQGVKAGIPDYALLVARGPYHGLLIELKVPAYPQYGKKAGVVSPEQEDWLQHLHAEGYCCHVCWGWEEARDAILAYLDLDKETA